MAQAKVITDHETFKPITLQITLETQGEVNALFSLCDRLTGMLYELSKNARFYKDHTYENVDNVTANISRTLQPFTK